MKKYFLILFTLLLMSPFISPKVSNAAIADGTYDVSYQVNKPGSNSASMANDYFAKPAKLIVKDGKMTMQLTIKKSAWVTEFNPPGGASVISSNEGADQRVVQFPIANANVVTIAMKIDIEDIDYHHSYSVDFVINSSALPEAKAPETVPATPEPPKKQETTNSSSGSNTSSNKPATTENSNASSSSEQTSQPATNEKAVSQEAQKEVELKENSEEQQAEEKEVVENPETSDELPILAFVLLIMAVILFIGTKKPKINE